jgi:Uma2 family endonuclease
MSTTSEKITRRTLKKLFTAEELLHLPTTGRRLELVKGRMYEMPPPGARHGSVAMRIGSLLNTYVLGNLLGRVFAAETGLILRRNPDTVRAPDASFVAADRLTQGELPAGYLELAPDLAVEVASPSDSLRELQEKVADWLRSGSRLVWVIYPATRSATVHRSLDDAEEISEDGHLRGDDVIPRFACELRELFF